MSTATVKAASLAPIRKLTIGGVVAFLVWMAVTIIEATNTLEIPTWLSGAATYVSFFGTAYLVKSGSGELVERET